MNSLICPKCSFEMNFVSYFKALSPWHFKCGECKAKLRLKKYRRASIIAAFVYGVILGSVYAILGLILIISDFRFYTDYFSLYLLFFVVFILVGAFLYEVIYYKSAKKYDFGLETR